MSDQHISTRLYEALSVLPGGPISAPVNLGVRSHRRQRRRQAVVMGLTAVTAVAVALPFALRSPATQAHRMPPVTPIATPAGLSAEELAQGRWDYLPEAPITVRYEPAYVWTGTSFMIWGGENSNSTSTTTYDDGAAYTPSTRTWSLLPKGPLGARFHAVTAWTGTEMVVWGGSDDHNHALTDGAAYDPQSRTWRTIARSPLPAAATGESVALRGEVLIFSGRASAVYDASTDTWTRLADLPASRDGSYLTVSAAVSGNGVIAEAGYTYSHDLGGGTSTGGAEVDRYLLDRSGRTWVRQPEQDDEPRGVGPLLWTGSENVAAATQTLVGGLGGGVQTGLVGHRYDPATDAWSPMRHGPVDDVRGHSVWTGKALLTYDTGTQLGSQQPGEAAAWDPATDRWYSLPPAPLSGSTASVWTGSELLEWGMGHGQFLRFTTDRPQDTCTSLTGSVAGRELGAGEVTYLVALKNTGTATCQLFNTPDAIQGTDDKGMSLTIPLIRARGQFASEHVAGPAEPGESEHYHLYSPTGSCPEPRHIFTVIRLHLRSGWVEVPADSDPFVLCPQGVQVAAPTGPGQRL